MSWKPFTTFDDFLKARQDFDQIPTIHVSDASNYLALLQYNLVEHPIVDIWEDLDTLRLFNMGNTLPKLHQVIGIAYNNSPNAIHGGTITLFNVYHKAIEWFPPHEQPSFIQKVRSELGHFGIKRTYSLFAPHYHWKGMYVQVQDVITRCEQCDRVIISFSSR
jgi:hypothetical protein